MTDPAKNALVDIAELRPLCHQNVGTSSVLLLGQATLISIPHTDRAATSEGSQWLQES